MSLHDGHRQRVRERFLSEGLDTFQEHQVLEMLLFYCFSRKDTNELAHRLIDAFGSLYQVLEAPIQDLERVPGIGKNAAVFLSFIAQFSRYYQINKTVNSGDILSTPDECGAYLSPYFLSRKNEVVFLLCLDAKCKVLCCKMVGEGSVNSAGVSVRSIVELALNSNATTVILAHNHPSGLAFPSAEDIKTTQMVAVALHGVDVILADHMIFADHDYVSMVQSGRFDPKVSYIPF